MMGYRFVSQCFKYLRTKNTAIVGCTLSGTVGAVGWYYCYDKPSITLPRPLQFKIPSIKTLFQPVYASWTTGYDPPKDSQWNPNWDMRDPIVLNKQKKKRGTIEDADYTSTENRPKADRHILLIRHGQYMDDAETDRDRYLTSLGREQAAAVGQRLKTLDLNYTSLTASTMTRAQETANIINKILPELSLTLDANLKEGCPVAPSPPIDKWQPEPHQFHQDGARIEAAYRTYFHRADPAQEEDSYEIIVGHANVIRYFVCRAIQVEPDKWLRMCLANCSITLITIGADGLVLMEMMGDHGFFQHEHISF